MKLYLLNAIMEATSPTVWRKIVIHPETPFPQLANVLFAAFGWREENEAHYFRHVQTGEVFDPESKNIFEDDYHDATVDWPLQKVGHSLRFWYNRPTDDHVLLITLEEIFKAKKESEWPRVVDGAYSLQTGSPTTAASIDVAALNADIQRRADEEEAELDDLYDDDEDDDDFDMEDFDPDNFDLSDLGFGGDDEDTAAGGHHRSDN